MKQVKKNLVATGFIMSLFPVACNKDQPETTPGDVFSPVILELNELPFDAAGGSANKHLLFGSNVYALVHEAHEDSADPEVEKDAYECRDRRADPGLTLMSGIHFTFLCDTAEERTTTGKWTVEN